MSELKGVTPSRPRPNPRPASPEKPKTYDTIGAGGRMKVRALIGSTFREVLAEMAAEDEAALAETEHVTAA
jgi:hypothetical protein